LVVLFISFKKTCRYKGYFKLLIKAIATAAREAIVDEILIISVVLSLFFLSGILGINISSPALILG
jgi:hypothetical protein